MLRPSAQPAAPRGRGRRTAGACAPGSSRGSGPGKTRLHPVGPADSLPRSPPAAPPTRRRPTRRRPAHLMPAVATIEVKVPSAGESVTEVQVAAWNAAEGDRVERDQVIVELETDKATSEVTAPATGRLAKIVAAEGDVVEVGDLLALIEEGGGGDTSDGGGGGEEAAGVAESHQKTPNQSASPQRDGTTADPRREEPTPSSPSAGDAPDPHVMPAAARLLEENGLSREPGPRDRPRWAAAQGGRAGPPVQRQRARRRDFGEIRRPRRRPDDGRPGKARGRRRPRPAGRAEADDADAQVHRRPAGGGPAAGRPADDLQRDRYVVRHGDPQKVPGGVPGEVRHQTGLQQFLREGGRGRPPHRPPGRGADRGGRTGLLRLLRYRRRGRRREGVAGPGDPQRGGPVLRGDRADRGRLRPPGQGGQDFAGRDARRDLHDHQRRPFTAVYCRPRS